MNTRIGIKKSAFTGVTTIDGNAYLDFVFNGQNYRIKYTDFIAQLGVTGTIEQDGDPAGSPVLDVQGAINAIRNIVGGFGIATSIDAQNSIQIDTDFSFDQTGETIVDDVNAGSPNFRSIVAGADVTVTPGSGTLTIAANTDGLKPANRVIVNQSSDFPPVSGGVIPLADNTEYFIGGDIAISVPLSFGQYTVVTGSAYPSRLSYAGTDAMFQGSGCIGAAITSLRISCPSASMLDFTDSAQLTVVNLSNLSIESADSIGSINIFGFVAEVCNFISLNDGIDVAGSNVKVFSLSRIGMASTSASFVGVNLNSAIMNSFEAQNVRFSAPAGAVGFSGLANSGNIESGQIGKLLSCEFLGGMTPLSGITKDDIRFDFNGNGEIPDTNPDALLSLSNNATATVISAANTPTLVAGTWVSQTASHYTNTAAGRTTYNGERDLNAPITVSMAIEPVSGTNKDMTAYLYVNGVQKSETAITVRGDSGNPRALTLIWQHVFQENDYVEVYVENNTDAIDLLVSSSVIRVR